MKKLMFAALATMATFALSAASISWDYQSYVCSEADTPLGANYAVYFFDANAGVTAAQMATALGTAGDLTKLNGNADYGYLDASGDAFIKLNGNNMTVIDNESKYGSVGAYAVILDYTDTQTIADASKFFIVDFGSHDITDAENGYNKAMFGEEQTIVGDPSGWSGIAAAPEPTSGLLLLLGVAGLALKRKRA